jgi:hypothetical protein
MEANGLLNELVSSTIDIDNGRKGLATDGEEHEGRIAYDDGISDIMAAFKEAPQTPRLLSLLR